jgi:hypothetical protein
LEDAIVNAEGMEIHMTLGIYVGKISDALNWLKIN